MSRPEFDFSDEEWATIRGRAHDGVRYAPLREREFRVVVIHPGDPSAPLFCQVVKQHLDHVVQGYAALSYTWGDLRTTVAVDCLMNDLRPAHERCPPHPEDVSLGRLHVTENLFAALRRCRHRQRINVMWIDAICIDQTNVAERNQQVRVMAEIYARAEKTAIWLGESSAVSGAGFEHIRKMARAPRIGDTAVLIETLTPERASSRDHWEGFADVLRRSWFTRVWVRQELAFSRDAGLLCGEDAVAWEEFESVVPAMLGTQLGFSDGAGPRYGLHHTKLLKHMRAMVRRPGWENEMLAKELLVLLWYCRECGATDPRDKVISVLGLCSPTQQSLLPNIDYSLTTEEIYRWVALASMLMFRNLNVLSHAGSGIASDRGLASLPSWVPDWSVACEVNLFDTPLPDHGYRAAGDTHPNPRFDPERPHRLGLTGRLVDVVRECAERTPSFLHLGTTHRTDLVPEGPEQMRIAEWSHGLERLRSVCERVSGAPASTEALWRTLCANKARADHRGRLWQGLRIDSIPPDQLLAPDAYGHSFRAWCRWYARPDGNDASAAFITAEDLKEWQAAMISATHHRRFGITAAGRMFLGPGDARPGDAVCVLNGGNVPFLLRAAEDGCFSLVGECYVHDLMLGEALRDAALEERTFVII